MVASKTPRAEYSASKRKNKKKTAPLKIIDRLKTGAQEFLQGKDVKAELTLTIDKLKKRYDFKNGSIAIDDSRFDVNGFVAQQKNGTQLNFKLQNEGKDMANLISLLPANIKEQLQQAEGSGEYAITA